MNKARAALVDFTTCESSVKELFGLLGAEGVLASQKRIVIKPNLVNASRPPVTTPVELVAAMVEYIRRVSDAEIIVAEGCGAPLYSTHRPFRKLGYAELAEKNGLGLVDLNQAELVKLSRDGCALYPELMMPRVVMESFLISVPVLKKHSMSGVTLTMKNMLGCAPPEHYGGLVWKKSRFHRDMHRSIYEVNLHRTPDLTVLDASIGMAGYHLGGPRCSPPVGKLAGGFDPVAVDGLGASLLKVDWRKVGHIKMAHGVLGDAEAAPLEK